MGEREREREREDQDDDDGNGGVGFLHPTYTLHTSRPLPHQSLVVSARPFPADPHSTDTPESQTNKLDLVVASSRVQTIQTNSRPRSSRYVCVCVDRFEKYSQVTCLKSLIQFSRIQYTNKYNLVHS